MTDTDLSGTRTGPAAGGAGPHPSIHATRTWPDDHSTTLQVVTSAVARVTLFEDRAEVVRQARARLIGGRESFAIDGVSALVDDPSVLVRIHHPGVRVLSTRVGRRIAEVAAASASELAAIEADLARARAVATGAQQALARAEAEQRRTESLEEAWSRALTRVPRTEADGGAAWRASLQQVEGAAEAGLDALVRARQGLSLAMADVARAESRLAQARRLEPREETRVVVEVEAELGDDVPVELVYRVPCALWRPEHRATLDGDAVTLTTYATVWQCTGEAWKDVPLAFSTARPARTASPPALTDDVLQLRKKTQQERRVVIVEAREQAIHKTGVDGARAVDEMPGVDDGGEPLVFPAARPATVPSDGAPCRVEIGSVRLEAQVDRVAMPELGPVVHVRARVVNRGARPVLAGPLSLVRGQATVGKGRLGFVGAGEPFEIGFGPDDGVRVRRQESEKRDTVPIIGTQRVTRTITSFVSNTSGTHRDIVLIERYPVSELGEVSVEVTKHVGGVIDAREGLVRYKMSLEPRSTHEVELVYRVEAAAKVSLRI